MRRFGLWVAFSVVLLLGAPRQSEAGFSMGLSMGGNYSLLVNNPKASERVGLNTELLLSYQLLMVSLDLGTAYDFLKKQVMVRPGARLHLGWFYLRLAFPFTFAHATTPDDMFNVGLLGGVGVQVKIRKFSIMLEGNVSPFFIRIESRGVLLPAEVRLGVAYHF